MISAKYKLLPCGYEEMRTSHFMLKHSVVKVLIAIAVVLSIIAFGLLHLGDYLVVNHPERSDVIVVLAGDYNDLRYWRGLELLREGYGERMVVDASSDRIYGQTFAEHAARFVVQTAGQEVPHINICTITDDSTLQEASNVSDCLTQIQPQPRSVLLVTNDFHTLRAVSILSSRITRYRGSVAAVNDTTKFGKPWWRHREWAKTCVYEWEKLLWWKFFKS